VKGGSDDTFENTLDRCRSGDRRGGHRRDRSVRGRRRHRRLLANAEPPTPGSGGSSKASARTAERRWTRDQFQPAKGRACYCSKFDNEPGPTPKGAGLEQLFDASETIEMVDSSAVVADASVHLVRFVVAREESVRTCAAAQAVVRSISS
jgi:hypothetical protein